MSEFVKALDVAELAPGACREVRVGDRMLAIHNVGGTFHATANACLHRGGPLGQGVLDGATVLCPWHAWGWDVRSGEHTQNPSMKLQTYEVRVEGGAVLVKVG
jgi:nitrite reductase/ring-hydroxylating ferredoxin subunit